MGNAVAGRIYAFPFLIAVNNVLILELQAPAPTHFILIVQSRVVNIGNNSIEIIAGKILEATDTPHHGDFSKFI